MYESSNTTYLDILVSSKNMDEFISGIFLISELIRSDSNLLEDVTAQLEEIELIKKRLDRDRESVALKISQQTTSNNLLQNTKTLREKYLANLNEEEKEIQYKIDEFYEQFDYIDSQILQFAKLDIGSSYIGGELAWPVPGYTTITSTYGMRTHPITGVYKLHTGVDISAPTGADFVAVNSGVVVTSGYNGAYGNMVIIDHGGGILSLYAHGSELLVEVGDTVSRDQPILKVGSTGYSTGPHAHFEIRLNGVCVDPMPYITTEKIPGIDDEVESEDEDKSEDEIDESEEEAI